MVYLAKTIGGFALVLLGGLAAAHGAATGTTWEMLGGLALMVLGLGLKGLKIMRRARASPAGDNGPD